MIRLRVVSSLIFGLGLLALGSGSVCAADGDHATDAQKRHAVAKQVEAAEGAKVKEEIREAIPGHQKGEHDAHGGDAHGSGSGAKPNNNPLEFKKDLALFTGVVFIVLLLILWKFAWGPISKALDHREEAVARQISEAAQSNEEAKQLLAQYGEKLDQAKDDVRGILDQARCDAEGVGQEIVEAAKKDAKAEQKRAIREIDTATGAALQELAEKSATMAVQLAGKIVGSELRAADHAKLVEQTVAQFGDEK